MKNMASGLFFILGAGASKDSGLSTYRGPEGLYQDLDFMEILNVKNTCTEEGRREIWDFLLPLYNQIQAHEPGPTYDLISDLVEKEPESFILTQNIDHYVSSIRGIPIVEIHGNNENMKCIKCKSTYKFNSTVVCPLCNLTCRPDITLFGEKLDRKRTFDTYKQCKKRFKYIIIVGTTLQFPYLRTFINKAKQRGAKVIHINPDDEYGENVRRGERWIQANAKEGLREMDIL